MSRDTDTISIVAELHYKNPEAALEWLERVFGFETRLLVKDAEDQLIFAESGWEDCTVAVIPEQLEFNRSPSAVNGVNTQTVRIRSSKDVKAHCEHARAAGAKIFSEPEQFFFGDLTYSVADIEGHIWSFSQTIIGAARPPPDGWTISFPSRK